MRSKPRGPDRPLCLGCRDRDRFRPTPSCHYRVTIWAKIRWCRRAADQSIVGAPRAVVEIACSSLTRKSPGPDRRPHPPLMAVGTIPSRSCVTSLRSPSTLGLLRGTCGCSLAFLCSAVRSHSRGVPPLHLLRTRRALRCYRVTSQRYILHASCSNLDPSSLGCELCCLHSGPPLRSPRRQLTLKETVLGFKSII